MQQEACSGTGAPVDVDSIYKTLMLLPQAVQLYQQCLKVLLGWLWVTAAEFTRLWGELSPTWRFRNVWQNMLGVISD